MCVCCLLQILYIRYRYVNFTLKKENKDCGHFIIPLSGMEPPTKRKYEASFKLKVINIAKGSNNCVAARKFDVTEQMVREWRKKKDDIREMPKNKCAM